MYSRAFELALVKSQLLGLGLGPCLLGPMMAVRLHSHRLFALSVKYWFKKIAKYGSRATFKLSSCLRLVCGSFLIIVSAYMIAVGVYPSSGLIVELIR